jgi:EpsI family protein
MQIGAYIGTEDSFPDSVYEELNADLHLYRHYRDQEGNTINLYIGYYGTAKGGRTGHNPYACLPGAGWGIIDDRKTQLRFPGGQATTNALVARKGDVYETVLHWYQSDKDKVLATGIQKNIQRFLGRIQHNRNDGAFVQVSMLTQRDGLEQAKKDIKLFAQKVLAILPGYWPEEQ